MRVIAVGGEEPQAGEFNGGVASLDGLLGRRKIGAGEGIKVTYSQVVHHKNPNPPLRSGQFP